MGEEFAGMSTDEVQLVQVRRDAEELAQQLVLAPFSARTVQELRQFAERAEKAYGVWQAWLGSPAWLRGRLWELREQGQGQW